MNMDESIYSTLRSNIGFYMRYFIVNSEVASGLSFGKIHFIQTRITSHGMPACNTNVQCSQKSIPDVDKI